MSKELTNIEPREIWQYFEKICSIPRPSKKEDKIISYLIDFAEKNRLFYKKDKIGNVVISKPATNGFEQKPSVVLQSHLDMVCEKNEATIHNFETDKILPYIEDGWVKARGTTLGADDGIGVAAQLAVLASNTIQHGPIECLFTIDEETGLTGAYNLEPGFFKGNILLNLDSEDEGIIFIGCAGGMDTTGIIKIDEKQVSVNSKFYKIAVTGLTGGHSGDDINKGLGNAVKIIARIARFLLKQFKVEISKIEGGNLRNAIAREAFIEFALPVSKVNEMVLAATNFFGLIKLELLAVDSQLEISLTEIQTNNASVLKEESSWQIVNLLNALPHGATGMSRKIPGLVETSTNLASIKYKDKGIYEIATSQRSSSNSLKLDIANRVEATFILGGAKILHSTGYPGWEPNTNSQILKASVQCYQKLFNKTPLVTAIHAGLECGLFLKKYPQLDMVSFGPTIKGAHSPDERVEIKSVELFWEFLLEILTFFDLYFN